MYLLHSVPLFREIVQESVKVPWIERAYKDRMYARIFSTGKVQSAIRFIHT